VVVCFFVWFRLRGVGWVLGVVGEVFVARVLVGGKVTVPLLVRDVLRIEEGDYVRVSIMEVIESSKGVRAKKWR
jgi:hypothetical protein